MNSILTRVVCPALWWTALVGSSFIGIGGMSEQAASDVVIRMLWFNVVIVTVSTFVVSVVVFTLRMRKL